MNPVLPYCWQRKGERIEIFPQRDKKVNLFGVFRPDSFCVAYECAANVNSDFLIQSLNDFCQYLDKPTVPVLDNAPTHRSAKFFAAVERWQEKDLSVFFLPRYSPHLNLAETFWAQSEVRMAAPRRLCFVCQIQAAGVSSFQRHRAGVQDQI